MATIATKIWVNARAARRRALALALLVLQPGCRATYTPPPPPRPIATPSIPERLEQYGPGARARWLPYFQAAGLRYPPGRFVLLALKHERELQLYAAGRDGAQLVFVRSFPILGASGRIGPKLREGDRQVPEGVYRIEYLNPNSISHLSLALTYPNLFDRAYAAEEGREAATLGGEIMIHGGSGSIGCIAVGDRAAEDLFVLAADSDWETAPVIVSPLDFRRPPPAVELRPRSEWQERLYVWLRNELATLPPPPSGNAP